MRLAGCSGNRASTSASKLWGALAEPPGRNQGVDHRRPPSSEPANVQLFAADRNRTDFGFRKGGRRYDRPRHQVLCGARNVNIVATPASTARIIAI